MGPELAAIIAAVMFFGLFVIIRLVAVLTDHQRKMAEILRSGAHDQQHDSTISREIADLKELVVQQSLAIEQLRSERSLSSESSISSRLNA